jgi:hypothetical protein
LLAIAAGAMLGTLAADVLIGAEAVTDRSRKQGMSEAPALIKAASLPCTVTDARKLQAVGGRQNQYEVVCQEGLGYLISESAVRSQPPNTFLCIESVEAGAAGGPPGGASRGNNARGGGGVNGGFGDDNDEPGGARLGNLNEARGGSGSGRGGGGRGGGSGGGRGGARGSGPTVPECLLAGNLVDAQRMAIAAYASRAKSACEVDRWRGVGRTSANTVIEISCKDGTGEILMGSVPLSPDKAVQTRPCLALQAGGSISCVLSDGEVQLARAEQQFAERSNRQCKVSKRRFMAATVSGDNFYEFLCEDGKGYIMQQKPRSEFGGTALCSEAIAGDLDGCQLKP